jgi:hypothetical protein
MGPDGSPLTVADLMKFDRATESKSARKNWRKGLTRVLKTKSAEALGLALPPIGTLAARQYTPGKNSLNAYVSDLRKRNRIKLIAGNELARIPKVTEKTATFKIRLAPGNDQGSIAELMRYKLDETLTAPVFIPKYFTQPPDKGVYFDMKLVYAKLRLTKDTFIAPLIKEELATVVKVMEENVMSTGSVATQLARLIKGVGINEAALRSTFMLDLGSLDPEAEAKIVAWANKILLQDEKDESYNHMTKTDKQNLLSQKRRDNIAVMIGKAKETFASTYDHWMALSVPMAHETGQLTSNTLFEIVHATDTGSRVGHAAPARSHPIFTTNKQSSMGLVMDDKRAADPVAESTVLYEASLLLTTLEAGPAVLQNKELQYIRIAEIKPKAEVYPITSDAPFEAKEQKDEGTTFSVQKSRNIYVLNKAPNVLSIFLGRVAYKGAPNINSDSTCSSLYAWTPTHGGMDTLFAIARRRIFGPRPEGNRIFVDPAGVFTAIYADNLYIFFGRKDGDIGLITTDGTSFEATSTHQSVAAHMRRLFRKKFVKANKPTCTRGWKNAMLHMVPLMVGNCVGVIGSTQIPVEQQPSGSGLTAVINFENMGRLKWAAFSHMVHRINRQLGDNPFAWRHGVTPCPPPFTDMPPFELVHAFFAHCRRHLPHLFSGDGDPLSGTQGRELLFPDFPETIVDPDLLTHETGDLRDGCWFPHKADGEALPECIKEGARRIGAQMKLESATGYDPGGTGCFEYLATQNNQVLRTYLLATHAYSFNLFGVSVTLGVLDDMSIRKAICFPKSQIPSRSGELSAEVGDLMSLVLYSTLYLVGGFAYPALAVFIQEVMERKRALLFGQDINNLAGRITAAAMTATVMQFVGEDAEPDFVEDLTRIAIGSASHLPKLSTVLRVLGRRAGYDTDIGRISAQRAKKIVLEGSLYDSPLLAEFEELNYFTIPKVEGTKPQYMATMPSEKQIWDVVIELHRRGEIATMPAKEWRLSDVDQFVINTSHLDVKTRDKIISGLEIEAPEALADSPPDALFGALPVPLADAELADVFGDGGLGELKEASVDVDRPRYFAPSLSKKVNQTFGMRLARPPVTPGDRAKLEKNSAYFLKEMNDAQAKKALSIYWEEDVDTYFTLLDHQVDRLHVIKGKEGLARGVAIDAFHRRLARKTGVKKELVKEFLAKHITDFSRHPLMRVRITNLPIIMAAKGMPPQVASDWIDDYDGALQQDGFIDTNLLIRFSKAKPKPEPKHVRGAMGAVSKTAFRREQGRADEDEAVDFFDEDYHGYEETDEEFHARYLKSRDDEKESWADMVVEERVRERARREDNAQ